MRAPLAMLCGSCLVLLVMGPAGAAPREARDVSAVIQPILVRHKVPGMVASTIEGAELVATGAAGVREAGHSEKVTLHDKFHIGSDTKAMTATLCAMLVEEGKLSWNTTVAEAFPELKDRIDPGWSQATLRLLLQNRGGAPANLDANGLWDRLWNFHGPAVGARQLLAENVLIHPPETIPGTKFVYSNAGFAIAGHMAERAMHQPWEELMRQRLFRPLGMTSAGFGAPGSRDSIDQPRGHRESGEPVKPGPGADNPVAIGPAGIVHCTAGDWAKFIALHLEGDEGHARLLKPKTFEILHAPAPGQDYAMGWGVEKRDWAGGRVLTHAGSNTMWYAVTWIAPAKNFAVLVMCNQGGKEAEKACDEACAALIEDYLSTRR